MAYPFDESYHVMYPTLQPQPVCRSQVTSQLLCSLSDILHFIFARTRFRAMATTIGAILASQPQSI